MQRLRGGNKVAIQRDQKEDAEHRGDRNRQEAERGRQYLGHRGPEGHSQKSEFYSSCSRNHSKKKPTKTDLEALVSAPCWWHHTKSQHGSICIFP